jgi:hypothetical protein
MEENITIVNKLLRSLPFSLELLARVIRTLSISQGGRDIVRFLKRCKTRRKIRIKGDIPDLMSSQFPFLELA